MAAASPDAIDSFDTRSAASATRTQVHRVSSKGDLVAMKAVKRALRTRRDIPLVFDEAADTPPKLGRSR